MSVDTEAAAQTFATVEKTLSTFTLMNLVSLVALIVVCVVAIRVILLLLDRAAGKANMDQGVQHFLHSGLSVGLWLVAICIILGYLGVPMTSVVALVSVLGLAISLAVQGTLSNLAGGIMILTAHPFKAGDFVDVAGVQGVIMDVGLIYTRLRTLDNRVVHIPNGDIAGKTITNFSAMPDRRVEIKVTASYDCDVTHVEETLHALCAAHPLVKNQPEPIFCRVSGYGSSSIEYLIRVWCKGADYWTVYFDLTKGIKEAFDKNDIEMTYDHVNVHMIKD